MHSYSSYICNCYLTWVFVLINYTLIREELLGTPRDGGNGKDIDWQKIAGKKGGNDADASIPAAQKIAISDLLEKVKSKSKIKQLPVRDDDDDEEEIDTKSKHFLLNIIQFSTRENILGKIEIVYLNQLYLHRLEKMMMLHRFFLRC